jgi:hypothetical protein
MRDEGFRGEQGGIQPGMFSREETGSNPGQMRLDEAARAPSEPPLTDLERQLQASPAGAASTPSVEVRAPDYLKSAPAVIDAPVTASHGTGRVFSSFDEGSMAQTSLYGPGAYLSDSDAVVEGYARAGESKVNKAIERKTRGEQTWNPQYVNTDVPGAAHIQQVQIPPGT